MNKNVININNEHAFLSKSCCEHIGIMMIGKNGISFNLSYFIFLLSVRLAWLWRQTLLGHRDFTYKSGAKLIYVSNVRFKLLDICSFVFPHVIVTLSHYARMTLCYIRTHLCN